MIAKGIEEGASDIHFEPEGKDMRVRYRVDGILHDATTVPRRMVAGVTSRLKIMASLDIAEKRLPQDGRVGLTVGGHPIDIRMASLPSVKGEKVVLRILDKEQALIGLERARHAGRHARAASATRFTRAYGATFVTGPTGSGKTTSLYAALNLINTPERNIITIEDPVEYQIPGLTQVQVNLKAGLTFASGLRSIVRSDPDVIMVGEIRDKRDGPDRDRVRAHRSPRPLDAAHQRRADGDLAAHRDGHRALPDRLRARLRRLPAPRPAALLALQGARRCCAPTRCATSTSTSDIEAYQAKGCKRCGFSGYKGRVGLYEAMTVTKEIRELAIERASADRIAAIAIEQGMRTLQQDGIDKVRMGITTIQEIARITGSAMAAD